MRFSPVGTILYGFYPPRPAPSAVAYCSCGLAIVAPDDARAEHAFERHQTDPAEVWIR